MRVDYKKSFYCGNCGVPVRRGSEREAKNGWKICPFCGSKLRTGPHYPHSRRPKNE